MKIAKGYRYDNIFSLFRSSCTQTFRKEEIEWSNVETFQVFLSTNFSLLVLFSSSWKYCMVYRLCHGRGREVRAEFHKFSGSLIQSNLIGLNRSYTSCGFYPAASSLFLSFTYRRCHRTPIFPNRSLLLPTNGMLQEHLPSKMLRLWNFKGSSKFWKGLLVFSVE